jgi:hypothetical protein
MPIVINGSGTVTGISVGGIPDGVVDTDVLAANAVTAAKLGTDEASGLAKAWVNFNGTGVVAIRASYNVSSITDNGTGDYTVNFTTALADADYAATFGTVRNDAAVRGGNFVCLHRDQAGGGTLPASGSLRITTPEAASSAFDAANADMPIIYVAIFR